MGFNREAQMVALDRSAVTAFIAEELAYAIHGADPFAVDHDCVNPAGHDFIASCGDVVCCHCGRISWR